MDTFEQRAGTAWRVPGFEHLTLLGEGGFGAAFLVRSGETGQVGVLKYVATSDEGARQDFRRESALLKGVASPYVARWYGHMEGPGHAAIFMEAVRGVSLRALLDERGPLAPEAALTVLKGSLLGLAAAHARGVVHRDYKPSNVMVGPDGVSKLIDFGIAGLVGEKASSGTPHYMAPEQWARLPSTAGTDVYAATCVFYECLTGRRPYGGTGLHELRAQHLTAEPPPVGSWPELSPLLASGMAKSQDQRPTDALAFVAELELVAGQAYGADWESRGWAILRAAAAALAPLAAVAVAGAFLTGSGPTIGATAVSSTVPGTTAATGGAGTVGVSTAAVSGGLSAGIAMNVLGKAALVVAGFLVVVGAGAAIVAANSDPDPKPPQTAAAPSPSTPVLSPVGTECGKLTTLSGTVSPVIVLHGSLNCATAMNVGRQYFTAIQQGKAQGQGLYADIGTWHCFAPYVEGRSHADSYLQCTDNPQTSQTDGNAFKIGD